MTGRYNLVVRLNGTTRWYELVVQPGGKTWWYDQTTRLCGMTRQFNWVAQPGGTTKWYNQVVPSGSTTRRIHQSSWLFVDSSESIKFQGLLCDITLLCSHTATIKKNPNNTFIAFKSKCLINTRAETMLCGFVVYLYQLLELQVTKSEIFGLISYIYTQITTILMYNMYISLVIYLKFSYLSYNPLNRSL